MKKLIILLILIGILTIVFVAKRTHYAANSTGTTPKTENGEVAHFSTRPGGVQTIQKHPSPSNLSRKTNLASGTNGDALRRAEMIRSYIAELRADPDYQFKADIRFYGKAVDESQQPLSNAMASFTWNRLATNAGIETGKATTQTDGAGLFVLENQTGNQLTVAVDKQGYYRGSGNPATFEFLNPASGAFYTPDPTQPVVFSLRKKGAGVPLITSQAGISPDLRVNIPRDGTPINIDVLHRSVGASGQIQMSENKPDGKIWQQATSWSFRMQIPDGGFVEQADEFPFQAPETGYQPVVEFDFQKGQTNWATGFKKDFYIRFGSPPRYGRLQVQTDISYGGATITYAFNPDGSRNLEPQ